MGDEEIRIAAAEYNHPHVRFGLVLEHRASQFVAQLVSHDACFVLMVYFNRANALGDGNLEKLERRAHISVDYA